MSKSPAKSEAEERELVLFDESDKNSVINKIPRSLRDSIVSLYAKRPDLTEKTEDELVELLQPTDNMDIMRESFWIEYNDAVKKNRKIVLMNIYGSSMTKAGFWLFCQKPENIAWMVCPPSQHILALRSYLNHGKRNIAKILRMNLFNEKGELKSIGEAELFLQTYRLVENRVFGSSIQRIEQKTQSHVTNEVSITTEQRDDIKRRIQELKEKKNMVEVLELETSKDVDSE